MEVLQGMKSGKSKIRLVDETRVMNTASLGGTGEELDDGFLSSCTTAVTPMIIIDVPVDDSQTIEALGGEQENSNNQSWDDLVYSITQRIFDGYRTETSWKLNAVNGTSSSTRNSSGTSAVSISDCFRLFSSEEILGEDDQWYCGNCKMHVRASKKIDLWKIPQVLIIHLKRFQYTRGYRNKIESIVDFPINDILDMEQFMTPAAVASDTTGLKYKLFGISNHMGSLYSGHYTAYAKLWEDANSPTHRRKDEWYSFNDSYVSAKGDSPGGCSSSNYLLFYQRTTGEAI